GEQGAPSTAPMQAEPAMAAPAETVMTDDPVVTPTMTDEVMDMVERLVAAPIQGSMQAPAAASGAIVLALDHARVMRVMGDVGTIVIGNPAIADVSMPDPGTMILTGKSYGETNLVMLDPAGEILAEQMLRVTIRGENTVSVFRGVQRTTLACAPTCEIRPTPGDAPEALQAGLSAFDQRNSAATNAANAR
ncbi:MAG: pilus assembly protein N-terminal domain-containing protein, partial [Devosiaceae bacterium]|nr:pilus assembly protein N-terminal domain-containing protein [Devosiaceae bacterium MH13]